MAYKRDKKLRQQEKKSLEAFDKNEFDLPLVNIDVALFSIIDKQLQVLLLERNEDPMKFHWMIPGRMIDLKYDHQIEQIPKRLIHEISGLRIPYTEQVRTIGGKKRDPRAWSISVLYYGICDITRIKKDKIANNAAWFPVDVIKYKAMAFDHNTLIQFALSALEEKTRTSAIPLGFLPPRFTLTESQRIFETILKTKLKDSAYRKRIKSCGVLRETNRKKRAVKNKAVIYARGKHYTECLFSRKLIGNDMNKENI